MGKHPKAGGNIHRRCLVFNVLYLKFFLFFLGSSEKAWHLLHLSSNHQRFWKFGLCLLRQNRYRQDLRYTVGIWNPTIGNPDFLDVGFQMVRFSNSRASAIVPTIQKMEWMVVVFIQRKVHNRNKFNDEYVKVNDRMNNIIFMLAHLWQLVRPFQYWT